jgi:TolB-like protein/Flp pilus assembly protein TadD
MLHLANESFVRDAEMPDIFLSYNREDQATAQRFAEAFEREGLSVWWDVTLRSGETYDQVTEAALRTAKAVVVLWSPRSVTSRWVRAEATLADRNRTLVPARIEACDLPIMFELTQTADLSRWLGETGDPVWRTFLADVLQMVGDNTGAPLKSTQRPEQAHGKGGAPFVGVLPLAARAGDEEIELLAEDLTEDIARELAQDSLFQVISASTMAEWRGAKINHKQLGRELGASYFIEGKLQRIGENVRLTVELIDVSTGGMLKAARHIRKMADISAAPEEFSAEVASVLGEAVIQFEAKRAMDKSDPCSGWDHVMRALALMERFTIKSIPRALEEAKQAIEQAPDLGLAHAILARLINLSTPMEERQRVGDKVLAAGNSAHQTAIQEHISQAMQLDGNNPAILHFVVGAYVNVGDADSALRLARRAVEMNPNSPHSHFSLGQALLANGHYVDAIAAFHRQLRLAPHDLNRPHGLLLLGACLMQEARLAEAVEAFDRSLALQPNNGASLALKAIAQAQRGEEELARTTAAQISVASDVWTADQHMFIVRALLRERAAEAEAVLRRLWVATKSGT